VEDDNGSVHTEPEDDTTSSTTSSTSSSTNSVKELRKQCKSLGIKKYSKLTKDALIDLLNNN